MKYYARKILLLFIMPVILLTICIQTTAQEEEQSIVRVGYFDLGEYYTENPDGSISSYDAAFLDEISKYTGDIYEYVNCGTWDNALEMLNRHEIDLIGTMQWTEEREVQYAICDASYGYSVAELAALGNSNYIYQDYESLSGARVGCIEGYVIMNQLQELMTKKNLTFTIQTYQTQTALDAALENGEIDLIAANAHAVHDDWKVIEKFAYAPFYFASYKDNSDLTERISNAIIQIHVYKPGFSDTLTKLYFPRLVSSPYTKHELECIEQGGEYTIYFDGTTAPLVWADESSGEMQGVLVDVCRQLSEQTGLNLQVKQRVETPDSIDDLTVTYRTLNYNSENDINNGTGVTNSILDQDFEMYHLVGKEYTEGSAYTIAAVTNRDGLMQFLAESYPDCTVIEYATPEACLKALSKGEADLTFLNTNVAENIVITDNMDQVSAILMTRVTFGIALQFHGENADMLAQIVNKGLELVDETQINNALVSYALNTAPDTNLLYLMKQHFGLTMMIGVIAVLLIIAFTVMFTYTRVEHRQRKRVEQANAAKTDFLARMSHDMRTPMNGILGLSYIMEDQTDNAEIKDEILKLRESGEYLLQLINDVLDVNKVESGKIELHPQPCDEEQLFTSIIELIKPQMEKKHIDLNFEKINIDWKYMLLDEQRVKQIFINLLTNAVKFTPEGGKIHFIMELVSENETMIRDKFVIRDTGIGMSESFLPHLFEPFTQENRNQTGLGGTGLGLSIVKSLVELMGGSITVKSRENEGTEFTLFLNFPLVQSNDVEIIREKKIDSCRVLQGKRILLCEDHPLNADIAIRLLESKGVIVIWKENGRKGLEAFEESESDYFDLILMDIRMPEMDGLESARLIRQLDRSDAKSIPIIAMTANAYDEDIQKSLDAGMNAHLAKPIEPDAMYQLIAQFI